ncbi:alpha-acetolactate decarboxylase [Algoriphagus boseongensis]|uniref:Alpha-acetolactate decarboxylase n=1 Tax=Algoriphagus boseongensis TaxID=1442587 RepID=A0A4R6T374_9BACT|nr:sialate O-acetylesterase [Algoriphagus boseongensis]TDQ16634.1 alpha-acetolactate decarboxylase [Algoriphagus boseongensis]
MKSPLYARIIFLILGIGFLLVLSSSLYGQDNQAQDWRINFPKTKEVVEKLPNPESLFIFFMAGQSNMAGRGFVEPLDTIPNPRILTIDQNNTWVYAKEPLHFYEPNLTGLDCGLSFARTLLDSLPEGVSIAIIPCAVGGSSTEQWLSNETYRGVTLLDNFKEKVALAKEYGTIKGILWHQGESNAKADLIPFFEQRLDSLLAEFRGIVQNETLPIVLGELGSFSEPEESRNNWKAINSIIHQVVDRDSNLALVETQDLKHKGDKVHFDSESQRTMGKRYAAKYLELVNARSKKADNQVTLIGEMKNVMWKGELFGNIDLDTLKNKTHLYGLGPVDYLKGEIMILDGKSYKSTVISDSTMKVEQTFQIKAPFFGYANISKWKPQSLPDSIETIKDLESYLDKITKNSPRPFLFKLNGTVEKAIIHVVNLPEGAKVSSPAEAHQGQVNYPLENEQGDILGFFSTEHKTIFTHHNTFLHMHFITADRQKMGHLDEVRFKKGTMTLYLPAE